ncbi:putative VirB6/TrlB/TraH-like protein [Candidatus Fokinia solitaria]|uniref:Putative VirB6/TrlB/TraH-like protein n=1 Tax=Candidatus Fokinia solitaria TaxID=1802984 RepID=A0A2U8BRG0_9RICK|nr:hypothetical protein [Candidatus Fokinia solitaria]AWD32934.1 putative VirB6/TrlB/TraH-like protein [Candidatus Fokinia solitaria]
MKERNKRYSLAILSQYLASIGMIFHVICLIVPFLFCIYLRSASSSDFYKSCTYSYDTGFYNPIWSNFNHEADIAELHYVGAVGAKCWARCQKECAALFGITLPADFKSTIQSDIQGGITKKDVTKLDDFIEDNLNTQVDLNLIEANQDTIQECIISCQSGIPYTLSTIKVPNSDYNSLSEINLLYPTSPYKISNANNTTQSTCTTTTSANALIDDLNPAYPYNTEIVVKGGDQVTLEIYNDSTMKYPTGITEVGMSDQPVMCGFQTSYIFPFPYSIYSLGGWNNASNGYAGCQTPADCATTTEITVTDPCDSLSGGQKKKCEKTQSQCAKGKNKKNCSSVQDTTTTEQIEITPINTQYNLGIGTWSARNANVYFPSQFVMNGSFFKIEYYGNYLYDCNYLQPRQDNSSMETSWQPYSCRNHADQYSLLLYFTNDYNDADWIAGNISGGITLSSTIFNMKELLNFQSTPTPNISKSCNYEEGIIRSNDDIIAIKDENSLTMIKKNGEYDTTAKINGGTYNFQSSSDGGTFSSTNASGTTKNATVSVQKESSDVRAFSVSDENNDYNGTVSTQNNEISATLDGSTVSASEENDDTPQSIQFANSTGLQGAIYTRQYPDSMRIVADMDSYLYGYLGACSLSLDTAPLSFLQMFQCFNNATHRQRCQFQNEESLYIRYNRNALPAISFAGYLSGLPSGVSAIGLRHFEPASSSSATIPQVYWTDNVGGFNVILSTGNCVLSNGAGLEYAVVPTEFVSTSDESYAISAVEWKAVPWQSGTTQATVSIPFGTPKGYLFLRIRYSPSITTTFEDSDVNSEIFSSYQTYIAKIQNALPNTNAANGYIVGISVTAGNDTDILAQSSDWQQYVQYEKSDTSTRIFPRIDQNKAWQYTITGDNQYTVIVDGNPNKKQYEAHGTGENDYHAAAQKEFDEWQYTVGNENSNFIVKKDATAGQYIVQGNVGSENGSVVVGKGPLKGQYTVQGTVIGKDSGSVLPNDSGLLSLQSSPTASSSKGGPVCRFITAYVGMLFGGADILKRDGNSVSPSEAGAVGKLFDGIVQNPMMLLIVRFAILLSIVIHALKFFIGMSEVTTKEVIFTIAKFTTIACFFSASSWQLFYDFFFKPFLGGMLAVTNIASGALALEDLVLCKSCVNSCDTGVFVLNNLDYIFNFIWSSMLKLLSLLRGVLTFCAGIMFMIAVYIYVVAMLKAAMMYLYAVTVMAILLIFIPVVISCILFNFSHKIFWSTVKYLFGITAQVVLVFSALSFLQVITFILISAVFNFTICKICLWNFFGLCVLHGYTALSDAHYPIESQVGLFIMLQILCFLAVSCLTRNAVVFFSALGAKIAETAKGVYGSDGGKAVGNSLQSVKGWLSERASSAYRYFVD